MKRALQEIGQLPARAGRTEEDVVALLMIVFGQ
jgi:hypothetical protein